MPGFKIGNSGGDGPDAKPKEDFYRDHRFKLKQFLGLEPTEKNGFIAVKEIIMPDETIDQLKVKTASANYSFAKGITYGDLRITFYATQALLSKLKNLKSKVHDPNTGIGDFSDYKDEVVIAMTGNDGTTKISIKFKNAYICGLILGTLSYTSSEIKLISASIGFDYLE